MENQNVENVKGGGNKRTTLYMEPKHNDLAGKECFLKKAVY